MAHANAFAKLLAGPIKYFIAVLVGIILAILALAIIIVWCCAPASQQLQQGRAQRGAAVAGELPAPSMVTASMVTAI